MIVGFTLQSTANVLRPVSVNATIDNMLSQILAPLSKKLRELQQTYKFRYQISAADPAQNSATQTSASFANSQMMFFADGANVCGKTENYDTIGRIQYQFKKVNTAWTERIDYAGCDQSKISLTEVIDVRLSPTAEGAPSRLSQNDIVAGRRILHLQKDELSRRYTFYSDLNHPALSIVSTRTTHGVQLEIWYGQTKIVSAQIKEELGNESFIYRRHGINDFVNYSFGNLTYNDPTEESLITKQLSQGTSYLDQLTGEAISYAQVTAKLNGHLIDVVASLVFRPAMEEVLSTQFPTGATVAQPSCLRNELLQLEAQFRSGAVNNPTLQELLNTYFPLWRKALDSGELVDSRALPCSTSK